jgi:hypothetical protein
MPSGRHSAGRRGFVRQQHGAVARGHQALDRVVVVQLDARARVQAGGGEPFRRLARQPGAGIVQDQRPFGQPGGSDARGRAPAGGQEGHDRVAPPRPQHQAFERRLGQGHQPHVQRSVGQAQQGFLRSQHGDLHVDPRMIASQRFQGLRQQVGDGAGGGAQPHAPGQALHLPLHVVERLVGFGQQAARAFQQRLADGRRPDLAALAGKQRRADAFLQVRHVQADGGRRQVQDAGGLGERAQVGDGDQGAEPVQADFAHGYPQDRSGKLNLTVMIFDFYYVAARPKIEAVFIAPL